MTQPPSRLTVHPVVLGAGLPFAGGLDRDVPLRLAQVTAYRNGTVELRYDVRAPHPDQPA